ncbi:hypothetical protein E2N92_03355 [Methanofollis formosanus]|uniref:Uncharacterized protein n=1 Tax=Methanofollis formosanus TaxID=299308 RepID=A0A8G1A0P1_9EURY|nr:hypothetical protein [Methanofollis formosanus]QYZ78533.1 hypothetical protein E2N92_03355 [Methanofollis formosanus]
MRSAVLIGALSTNFGGESGKERGVPAVGHIDVRMSTRKMNEAIRRIKIIRGVNRYVLGFENWW